MKVAGPIASGADNVAVGFALPKPRMTGLVNASTPIWPADAADVAAATAAVDRKAARMHDAPRQGLPESHT